MSNGLNQNDMKEIDLSPIKKHQTKELCEFCLNVKRQFSCPNYLKCPYVKDCKANVVINEYKNTREVLIFKDAFWQRGTMDTNTNVDRGKNWMYDDHGVLVPTEKNLNGDIFKLLNCLKDSRKRATQNFYGYTRCNDWSYFLTLTLAKKDKLSEEQVNYVWKLFRQKMQYRFPDIKIICVREHHKKGGLHFHGLIGNCNLDKYLRIAINSGEYYEDKKGNKLPNKYYMQQLVNEFNDPVYNIDPKIYSEGHLTIVKIKDANSDKLANYLSKYFLKDNVKVSFKKKTYWHTNNLDFYNKLVSYYTDEEKQDFLNLVNLLNYIHFKETDKAYIYTLKK